MQFKVGDHVKYVFNGTKDEKDYYINLTDKIGVIVSITKDSKYPYNVSFGNSMYNVWALSERELVMVEKEVKMKYTDWKSWVPSDKNIPKSGQALVIISNDTGETDVRNVEDVVAACWDWHPSFVKVIAYRTIVKPVVTEIVMTGYGDGDDWVFETDFPLDKDTHKITLTLIDGVLQLNAKVEII